MMKRTTRLWCSAIIALIVRANFQNRRSEFLVAVVYDRESPTTAKSESQTLQDSIFSEQRANASFHNFTSPLEHWKYLLPKVLPVTSIKNSLRCKANDSNKRCVCDPFVPMEGKDKTGGKNSSWFIHHDKMIRIAKAAPANLDVLFLGDSIIERWNGTRYLGRRSIPENREAFGRKFSKARGSKLEGLAFGSAEDFAQHLNWHIQNGVLPESINPKVIWILIGTNNFFGDCSTPDTVVSAIMEVALQIRKRKPFTKIVLQGLLPRGDRLGSIELETGWKLIQETNKRLESIAHILPELYYYGMDESLFLTQEEGRTIINKKMMQDCVHPTSAAYGLMGDLIEAKIVQLLS